MQPVTGCPEFVLVLLCNMPKALELSSTALSPHGRQHCIFVRLPAISAGLPDCYSRGSLATRLLCPSAGEPHWSQPPGQKGSRARAWQAEACTAKHTDDPGCPEVEGGAAVHGCRCLACCICQGWFGPPMAGRPCTTARPLSDSVCSAKACMLCACKPQKSSVLVCRGDSLVPAHRVEGLAAQRKAPALNSHEVLTAIVGPRLSARRLRQHLQATGSFGAPWLLEVGLQGTRLLV